MDEERPPSAADDDAVAGDQAATEDIPPEALEEARRWADVPVEEPEESTGIDV
jgi:hypothetical protein